MNKSLYLIECESKNDKINHWDISYVDGLTMIVKIKIPWVNGAILKYELIIKDIGNNLLKVQENPTKQQLPNFCPQRHINENGYFCLGLTDYDKLNIIDSSTAKEWLNRLIIYLQLQRKASLLKKWDMEREWAHGESAYHQVKAMNYATKINNNLQISIINREIKIIKNKNRSFFSLFFTIYNREIRINLLENKLLRRRNMCLCGSKKRIARCSDHANDLLELAKNYIQMIEKEEEFWNNCKSKNLLCCNTIKKCPLKL